MHHCTVDGVSGASMMVYLFDMEPTPAAYDAPEWKPERIPTDMELVGFAMRSRLRRRAAMFQVVPEAIGAAVKVVQQRLDRSTPSGGTPLPAPRTSFNSSLTAHRKVAYTNIALDDIKESKNAFGTTVNDVVLAICTGALRHYLEEGNELPDKPLVVTCPVSVRPPGESEEEGAGSNQVSAMFVELPVQLEDPIERLRAIHESTKGAKEEHKAIGAKLLMNAAEFAAPTLFAQAARLYTGMKLSDRHPVVQNLVVSNVPGPPFPLYFAGARLVAMHPLGPVMEGAGLNITVLSYLEDVGFGFIACRELMPGLWDLAAAVHDATEELKKAAANNAAPPKPARAKKAAKATTAAKPATTT
jgi:WS/DGAT/MGAT family acyltransferase